MGGVISSITGSIATSLVCCCCGAAASKCCCACCPGKEHKTSGKKAKIFYLGLQFLAVVFALNMRYWGGKEISISAWTVGCDESDTVVLDGCRGNAAVYRISMMQAIFFFFMMFGSWWSADFHVTQACGKIVMWIGLMVASFFIPNTVFDDSGYAWFSRVVSVLFLLLQLVILIDFAYKWNDGWLDNADEVQRENKTDAMNKWHYGMLGCAAVLFLVWFIGLVLMFKYYNTCSLDKFFTAFTLLLPLLATLIALWQGAAILPASVIAAYSTYLCWGALNANPDAACAAVQNGVSQQSPAVIVAGIIFAAASLVWMSLSTAESAKTLELEFQTEQKNNQQRERLGSRVDGKSAPLNAPGDSDVVSSAPGAVTAQAGDGLEMSGNGSAAGGGISNRDVKLSVEDEDQQERARHERDLAEGGEEYAKEKRQERLDAADAEKYWIFHFVMMLGAVYLAMLLTDWGSSPDPSASTSNSTGVQVQNTSTQGKTSMWVKIISQWLTNLLYIWTLVAPRLCPDREWN